jgi:hypothetical protein
LDTDVIRPRISSPLIAFADGLRCPVAPSQERAVGL